MTTQTEIEVGGKGEEEVAVAVVQEAPVALNVGRLMEMALGQGPDGVEALERLVALQERTDDRNAQRALTLALGAFQAACPHIRQSKTAKIATKSGSNYNFTYAPLDEITRTIQPHLRAQELSFSFDSKTDGKEMHVVCRVSHSHGAYVESRFTCSTESESKRSAAQDAGAALTYAKRQALVAALGLTTTTADIDAIDAGDVTPIDTDQLVELRNLLQTKDVDIDRFLALLAVESLDKIPAVQFKSAMTLLRAKRDKE